MSYWNNRSPNNARSDSFGLGKGSPTVGGGSEFYEIEPAVVLDIILDKEHPFIKKASNLELTVDADRWPGDLKNKKAEPTDIDYSWIGRALIRMQITDATTDKEKLVWAYPIESGISEYPLINEIVMIIKYRNKYFYSRRLNIRNLPNESVDFGINKTISGKDNNELYTTDPYQGKPSQTSFDATLGYKGIAGKYYKINDKMRRVTRYEGDLVIESRFGQVIRFGAYDSNRGNDNGDPKNTDYVGGGGNPMIIIRNRQRKLLKKGEPLSLVSSPNPATIIGTDEEKNAGGYIESNINHDGSTLAITSGQTISKWVTTCYKKIFGVAEEVSSFNGKTTFKYPTLNGDQIVIQSDRLVLSSRYAETFHYSKKRYAIVTDNEYTVDAHQQLILTTNTKTVINSPAIYLGEYDITDEPAVLGQTLANWLYDLCEWIRMHTHWYIHSHVDAGKESPSQTQLPVQIQQLIALRDRIHRILSRRVFITGGGFAPGKDGGKIVEGTEPVKINVGTGSGVPGGWKGANKR